MIVALSGSTGFVGQSIMTRMRQLGWTIRVINRDSFALPEQEFLSQKIEGTDVVINLCGASISKRWTNQYKKEILDSRILTTRKIVDSINRAEKKPSLLISASAIGIYDSVNTHSELSESLSDSFLAHVCRCWEHEALLAEPSTRVAILRLGVVLGRDGGALSRMHLPFSIGLGGKLGSGKQPFSFIHINDLVEAVMFTIENSLVSGVVNAVSPYPVTNAEFTETLGKVLEQPAWFTVPAFALKMVFGEASRIMLDGQRAMPEKLLKAGFNFKYPTIRNTLVKIYG
jgi:uncharacterized protein (TIGR01777 family)